MANEPEKRTVSVVIPTLNEAKNIGELLRRLLAAFRSERCDAEIIIADGGSTDRTGEEVRKWAERAPVRFVSAASGRGLSGDVLAAAQHARGKVVVVMDADLSHPPEMVPLLAAPVLDGSEDVVVGSRYVKGGSTPDWSPARRIISLFAGLLAWPLVDVRDPTAGFFALRRERLLAVDPQAKGFKLLMEVLLSGGDDPRVKEIPICFHDRLRGHSKMGMKQAWTYLSRIVALTGCAMTIGNTARFALVGLLGLIADIGVFHLLWHSGLGLSLSHIASFFTATVVNYILNTRWTFSQISGNNLDWRRYGRFFTVCLMALLLRGGVLASLIHNGWTANSALIAAVLAAAGINYLGNVFFVFRRSGVRADIKWRMAAIGIVFYSVLLRVVYLGVPNLIPEEAYYWNYALHPALGYLDHPPMIAWIISLCTAIFGDNEFAIRIGALLCWFITAGFSFGFALNLSGKKAAIVTLALVSMLPMFFIWGFFTMPDAPLMACWAGALFFIERALLANKRLAWWGAGICLGLGALSKYTIILLGIAIPVFILTDRQARKWLLRPEPYAAMLLAALLFTPVIRWNSENGWISFAFQTAGRMGKHLHPSLHLLIASVLCILTPAGVIGVYRMFFPRDNRRGGNPDGYAIAPSRNRVFVFIFTFLPLSVFILFSLIHQIKFSWAGPLWLAALPGLAMQVSLPKTRGWTPTFIALALFYGAVFHYITIGLPGVPYPTDFKVPVAWREMGEEMERLEDEITRNLGEEPLIVGMDKYFVASEMSFYMRDTQERFEPTTSRNMFGFSAVMYKWWADHTRHDGKTLLLVSTRARDLSDKKIGGFVQRMDPIREIRVTKNNVPAGTFFYRVVYGYIGGPPEYNNGAESKEFPGGCPRDLKKPYFIAVFI